MKTTVRCSWIRALPLALLVLAAGNPHSSAREIFVPAERMIRGSEFITIVQVTAMRNKVTPASPRDYTQISDAAVVENLKGKLPENIELFGGGAPVQLNVEFSPGRYLVFLRRDAGRLVGSFAPLSAWRINDQGSLQWPEAGKPRNFTTQPLEKVRAEIRSTLEARGR